LSSASDLIEEDKSLLYVDGGFLTTAGIGDFIARSRKRGSLEADNRIYEEEEKEIGAVQKSFVCIENASPSVFDRGRSEKVARKDIEDSAEGESNG
jgi:hypothetical protein